MMNVELYTADKSEEWNRFVASSKNGTFLFHRDYMDYHSDRFRDSSLMVYYKQRLFAVFPANRVGGELYSHQGLSYGGLLIDHKATAHNVCEAMQAVNSFIGSQGIERVTCKAVPYIYHSLPSDETLYAYTEVCHARLTWRDIASVVVLGKRLPLTELRRRGQRKAGRHGISIRYSDDWGAFWNILTDNLQSKYQARPVHSLEEITLLRNRFPASIRLLAAFKDDEMVAGTVLFFTPKVIKTQYISASPTGKEVCALDLLFSWLMAAPTDGQVYLDMGTSAQDHCTALKLPLIFQKEGFGARAVCYDTYEWTL